MFHVKHSASGAGSCETVFADAEVAEDHVQNVLDVDPAGQPAERVRGDAQLLGQQILAGGDSRIRARRSAARVSSSARRWRSRVTSAGSAPPRWASACSVQCGDQERSNPSPVDR